MTTITRNGDDLERLVGETRRRLRRNAVLTGATVVVAAAVGWLVIAAVLDLLAPLPVPLRVVLGGVFWLLLVGLLLATVAWPALQPLGLDRVAYRIERTVPRMHNRLITVLDVRRRAAGVAPGAAPAPAPGSDDAFVERLIEQTRTRLEGYQIEHVASRRPLRYGAISATVAMVVVVVLLVALGEPMVTAVARILRPTAAIAPVSWVKLVATSGDVKVLQGEPVTIRAAVEHGRVEHLLCVLMPTDGKSVSYPMEGDSTNGFTLALSEVGQSYQYQIRGGRTWTATHRVTMVRRPVVEELGAVIRLPDYMKIADTQPVDEHAETIAAPRGAHLELHVKVEGDAQRGEILRLPLTGAAA